MRKKEKIITEKDIKKLFRLGESDFQLPEAKKEFEFGPKEKVPIAEKAYRANLRQALKETRKEIKETERDEPQTKEYFSPSRLERLAQKKEKRAKINIIVGSIITVIIAFALTNLPAVSENSRFWWKVEWRGEKFTTAPQYNLPTIGERKPKEELPPVQAVSPSTLKIEKIGIEAPIFWNTHSDKIIETLEGGVAHYQGTALPNEVGNVFIVGHSSNFLWAKGDYKQVFALLDKLVVGDKIELTYRSQTINYQVKNKKIVRPDQVEVLKSDETKKLSLMTCWPIGTTFRRLIVEAVPI